MALCVPERSVLGIITSLGASQVVHRELSNRNTSSDILAVGLRQKEYFSPPYSSFFFLKISLMCIIFKVFIEFVTILLLFFIF